MLADWLEASLLLGHGAQILDVDDTGLAATFDATSKRWTARLRRAGVDHVLHPAHLVIATGMSGEPRVPELPGLRDFAGETLHTIRTSTANGGMGGMPSSSDRPPAPTTSPRTCTAGARGSR